MLLPQFFNEGLKSLHNSKFKFGNYCLQKQFLISALLACSILQQVFKRGYRVPNNKACQCFDISEIVRIPKRSYQGLLVEGGPIKAIGPG
jgi:hypothetical protein